MAISKEGRIKSGDQSVSVDSGLLLQRGQEKAVQEQAIPCPEQQ
jgi:hypothetical protein